MVSSPFNGGGSIRLRAGFGSEQSLHKLFRAGNPTKPLLDHQQGSLVVGSRQIASNDSNLGVTEGLGKDRACVLRNLCSEIGTRNLPDYQRMIDWKMEPQLTIRHHSGDMRRKAIPRKLKREPPLIDLLKKLPLGTLL